MKDRTFIEEFALAVVFVLFISAIAQRKTINSMQEQIDLQRECIEVLEDQTQYIADSLGIEW